MLTSCGLAGRGTGVKRTVCMAPRVMELSKEILQAYGRRYGTPRSRFWIISELMAPTSGLDAAVFALHLRREVDMYGFGLKGAKKLHYFANATNEEVRNSHDFPAEAYFLLIMPRVGMTILLLKCLGRDMAN